MCFCQLLNSIIEMEYNFLLFLMWCQYQRPEYVDVLTVVAVAVRVKNSLSHVQIPVCDIISLPGVAGDTRFEKWIVVMICCHVFYKAEWMGRQKYTNINLCKTKPNRETFYFKFGPKVYKLLNTDTFHVNNTPGFRNITLHLQSQVLQVLRGWNMLPMTNC